MSCWSGGGQEDTEESRLSPLPFIQIWCFQKYFAGRGSLHLGSDQRPAFFLPMSEGCCKPNAWAANNPHQRPAFFQPMSVAAANQMPWLLTTMPQTPPAAAVFSSLLQIALESKHFPVLSAQLLLPKSDSAFRPRPAFPTFCWHKKRREKFGKH